MNEMYYKYSYDGPIMLFDKCIADHWKGETMASTENKARNNLSYQVKKELNLIAGSKIILPGKIKMIK